MQPRPDEKSTLMGLPSDEYVMYLVLCALCLGAWAAAACAPALGLALPAALQGSGGRLALAVGAGFGPVWAAQAVQLVKGKSASLFDDNMGDEGVSAGSDKAGRVLGMHPALFHVLIGNLFCSVPVAYMAWLSL